MADATYAAETTRLGRMKATRADVAARARAAYRVAAASYFCMLPRRRHDASRQNDIVRQSASARWPRLSMQHFRAHAYRSVADTNAVILSDAYPGSSPRSAAD